MNSADLEWVRKEVAKRIGIRRYPEQLWQQLLADSSDLVYTAETREGLLSDIEKDAAIKYSAYQLGLHEETARQQRPSGKHPDNPQDTDPGHGGTDSYEAHEVRPVGTSDDPGAVTGGSDAIAKRSAVFSESLAVHATTVYSGVRKFRAKYLDDALLSPHQARELLTSPVAAHWGDLPFRKFGVPIAGHTYRVTQGEHGKRGTYSLVEVLLPGGRVSAIEDSRPLQAGPWIVPVGPENAKSNSRLKRELDAPAGPLKILAFPGQDGYTHRVLALRTSVLGRLHEEVGHLVRKYPWEEQDATWFVLTGETPAVVPLSGQFRGFGNDIWEDSFSYGFITLKVEPWVPAQEVGRFYLELQRKLRGVRRARGLEEKSLRLLQFVNERENVASLSRKERRRLAPGLVAAWDKENAEDAYEGNTWKFWRDYHRARRAVMAPTYEWRGGDS
jgi:hypothetical protein